MWVSYWLHIHTLPAVRGESCSSLTAAPRACKHSPAHVCAWKNCPLPSTENCIFHWIFPVVQLVRNHNKNSRLQDLYSLHTSLHKKGSQMVFWKQDFSHEQWFKRMRISASKNVSFGKLWDLLETPLVYFLCFDCSASIYVATGCCSFTLQKSVLMP